MDTFQWKVSWLAPVQNQKSARGRLWGLESAETFESCAILLIEGDPAKQEAGVRCWADCSCVAKTG